MTSRRGRLGRKSKKERTRQYSTRLPHIYDHLSQLWTATGRPESCRAATNCPMTSCTGPDVGSSSTKSLCSAGNSSVTVPSPPMSSFRASATRGAIFLSRYRSLSAVNGRKSSSHRVLSTSSCQHSRGMNPSWMSRRSKVEIRGRDNLQSCAMDESCQFDSVHEIRNDSRDSRSKQTVSSLNVTFARLSALNASVEYQLMKKHYFSVVE